MTPPLPSGGGTTPLTLRAAELLLIALIFVTPFSKAAVEICSVLLLLAWFTGRFRPIRAREALAATRPAEWVWLTLALYLGLCALSILYSTRPELSLRGFTRKTLEYALQFLIAADLARRFPVAERSSRALQAAAWLVLLYGIFQEWLIFLAPYQGTAVDPIRGKMLHYTRMVGPYENPNDLATFFMVAGLLATGRLTGPLSRGGRIHLSLLALGMAGGLVRTSSMGGLIGFTAGMGLLLLLNLRRIRTLMGLTLGTALVLALFIALAREHLQEILTLADTASLERLTMWRTGWAMIRAKPLLGHGLNTFMANYNQYAGDPGLWPAYAHNCYIQIAAETGLAGLAIFLLFLAALAAVLWKALRFGGARINPGTASAGAPALLMGLGAGTFAFLVQSFFDTNLYALRQAVLFWTLSGVALGLSIRLLRAPVP